MKNLYILLIVLVFYACEIKNKDIDSAPLSTVIKFISSESFIDTVEVRKYIDIDKVYSKYIDKENPTADQVWKNKIKFLSNLDNDRKFTSHFKFYNYTISENDSSNTSKIIFTSKKKNDAIKAIEYSLMLDVDKKWRIVDIVYKK